MVNINVEDFFRWVVEQYNADPMEAFVESAEQYLLSDPDFADVLIHLTDQLRQHPELMAMRPGLLMALMIFGSWYYERYKEYRLIGEALGES